MHQAAPCKKSLRVSEKQSEAGNRGSQVMPSRLLLGLI
jgi:hypothetical protein